MTHQKHTTVALAIKLTAIAAAVLALAAPAHADMAAAQKWVDKEFKPSTLNRE